MILKSEYINSFAAPTCSATMQVTDHLYQMLHDFHVKMKETEDSFYPRQAHHYPNSYISKSLYLNFIIFILPFVPILS